MEPCESPRYWKARIGPADAKMAVVRHNQVWHTAGLQAVPRTKEQTLPSGRYRALLSSEAGRQTRGGVAHKGQTKAHPQGGLHGVPHRADHAEGEAQDVGRAVQEIREGHRADHRLQGKGL